MQTAAHLYAECDGIEFLRSACKLDMRFVPDEQVLTLSEMSHAVDATNLNYLVTRRVGWWMLCSLSVPAQLSSCLQWVTSAAVQLAFVLRCSTHLLQLTTAVTSNASCHNQCQLLCLVVHCMQLLLKHQRCHLLLQVISR